VVSIHGPFLYNPAALPLDYQNIYVTPFCDPPILRLQINSGQLKLSTIPEVRRLKECFIYMCGKQHPVLAERYILGHRFATDFRSD
jgi:hypothetical protein